MAVKDGAIRRLLRSTLQQKRTYSAPADRAISAAKQKYVPTSGTYPKGFLAGTAHAGVKESNKKYDDVTMVVSDTPCAAAAVFTRNIFQAAPVLTSKSIIDRRKGRSMRGVIVNSGCANAVTGKLGLEHAHVMASVTDDCFNDADLHQPNTDADAQRTLVMSTGVIGQRLPIDRVREAIPKAHQALGSTHEHWLKAAQAICTTDTFPKLLSRNFTLPSHPDTTYSIAGMTKGAGMIHPNMATLLGIICTDAKVAASSMRPLLSHANVRSFNSITIDGDTSTNDTVAFFANGAAAPASAHAIHLPAPVNGTQPAPNNPDAQAFSDVLETFMQDLAKLVVRDGEGATKFVTVRVLSDVSYVTAKRAANSIARSALVKTALYGKDANWGRILCAVGYAPGIMGSMELPSSALHQDTSPRARPVIPERTSVSFIPADGSPELQLLVRGEPQAVDEARAKQILEMEDLEILVRLDDGPVPEVPAHAAKAGREAHPRRQREAVVWTCDFSHEYVTINGDYRT